MHLQQTTYENIVEKERNALDEQFLLCHNVFISIQYFHVQRVSMYFPEFVQSSLLQICCMWERVYSSLVTFLVLIQSWIFNFKWRKYSSLFAGGKCLIQLFLILLTGHCRNHNQPVHAKEEGEKGGLLLVFVETTRRTSSSDIIPSIYKYFTFYHSWTGGLKIGTFFTLFHIQQFCCWQF